MAKAYYEFRLLENSLVLGEEKNGEFFPIVNPNVQQVDNGIANTSDSFWNDLHPTVDISRTLLNKLSSALRKGEFGSESAEHVTSVLSEVKGRTGQAAKAAKDQKEKEREAALVAEIQKREQLKRATESQRQTGTSMEREEPPKPRPGPNFGAATRSNMSINLAVFINHVMPILTTFFGAFMSKDEMNIWQNGQIMLRVLALADEDGTRYSRTDGQRTPMEPEVKVNIIRSNGVVEQISVNLDELKAKYRSGRPKKTDFRKGKGSKSTDSSICAQCMALWLKSVMAPDQLFAPGVKVVRDLKMPAQFTVLAEGINVPSKYVKHMRNTQGVFWDLAGLMRLKDSGDVGRSKTFDVILKKLKGRCRTEEQRSLVGAINLSDNITKFSRVLETLCTSFLVESARTTRAFLPPVSSLASFYSKGKTVENMDFMSNAKDALTVMKNGSFTLGVNSTFTMKTARTCVAVGVVASPFVARDTLSGMFPNCETCRANMKANSAKPKKNDEFTIQGFNTNNLAYEERPATSQRTFERSWQVSVVNTFGTENVFHLSAIRELFGDGKAKSVNVRTQVKALLAMAEKKNERVIKSSFVNGFMRNSITISGLGLFSSTFDETEGAEKETRFTVDETVVESEEEESSSEEEEMDE